MAYRDLVKQVATVNGTGAFTLGAAVAGFQTMNAGRNVGDKIGYSFRLGSEWEVGIGTLAAGGTLARAPSASSNAGALVNFAAGTGEIVETVTAANLSIFERSTSARVFVLSSMGVQSDADLTAGSTTFGTDSTAIIQAILDQASEANPIKVVWDVKCSGTGWKVKSGTLLEALPGCGAILRTNSNKSLFENANIRFTPGTRIDKNIAIKGGVWNGNRGPSTGSGATLRGMNNSNGDGITGINCVFRFYGVENLIFEPDLITCPPCYHVHMLNVKRMRTTGVKYEVGPGAISSNDGHNLGGNCEDLVYRDLQINAHDDPISISPDDVWRVTNNLVYPYYPANCMGPIKNVLVDNLLLNSELYGVRLMAPLNRLDNVVIRNITGRTTGHCVFLDNYMESGGLPSAIGNGNIGTVHIDGVDLASFTGTAIVNIKSSVGKLKISNMRRNNFDDNCPSIFVGGSNVTIQSLEIDGYDSYDAASSKVVAHIRLSGSVVVKELRIINARVRRADVDNGSKLLELIGGATVEKIVMSNVSADNIKNVLDNISGTIGRINASNITHQGGGVSFVTASNIPRLNLSGYDGGTATSGTFNQTSGDGFVAVSGTAPAPVVNFATGAVAVDLADSASLSEAANTKSLVGAAATANAYTRFGGAGNTVKLPAGVDGWVGFKFTDAGQYESQVGFNGSTTVAGSDKPAVGFVMTAAGSSTITNGVGNSGLPAPVAGSIYAVWARGSVLTFEKSTDMGATWTVLRTFGPSRNSDIYVHGAMYNGSNITFMQGVGLTA